MQAANEKTGIWKIIIASSAGTLIEWYDFYLFGVLATTLASTFFAKGGAGLLQTLGTFAAGFIVRPFGAVVFGRIGDMIGRKYTFLLTLLMMGGSTCAIGLLPTYAQVGVLAPALLLALRLVQGLALGGQYGGAATYVAETSPDGKRGFYTSFIQTTATLGLFVALGVTLGTRYLTQSNFEVWGWRIPFLLSIVLVVLSYVIRSKIAESPMFERLKAEGKVSKNPLKESFANPANRKLVLLALFGLTAGQGVVWYTGQFYALLFMQTVLNVNRDMAYFVIAIALLLGTPFFIFFGAKSDQIGRKKIIMWGCALAAVLYVPIYMGMLRVTDVSTFHDNSTSTSPVQRERKVDPETHDKLVITTSVTNFEEAVVSETTTRRIPAKPGAATKTETKVDLSPGAPMMVMLSMLILLQVIFVTMVYGPIAAFLVELFPTRIRYTSLSVPYHLGNGVFGGLVPVICVALNKWSGNPLVGLAYPIFIALTTLFIGGLFIREKRDVKLWDEEAPMTE